MEGDAGIAVEEAKQRGFLKGLNLGLLWVAGPCALIGAYRPFYDYPRLEQLFGGVKVALPKVTVWVLEMHQVIAVLLVLGLIACVVGTRLWGHRRKTVVLNGTFLFLSISWLTLVITAVQLPLASLFIDRGRP